MERNRPSWQGQVSCFCDITAYSVKQNTQQHNVTYVSTTNTVPCALLGMDSSTNFQAPPQAAYCHWSCYKVYHKQEVCFFVFSRSDCQLTI